MVVFTRRRENSVAPTNTAYVWSASEMYQVWYTELKRGCRSVPRCIEYAHGAKHPDDAGALIESIAEKLKDAGMAEVRGLKVVLCSHARKECK